MIDSSALPERFWRKITPEPNSGCWLWTACTNKAGYGIFGWNNKCVLAHRLAYEVLVGPMPEGLVSDHLCRTRCCVNPAHIEPVTNGENTLRGRGATHQAEKTHCPYGHPYDYANTYIRLDGQGRQCRTCTRERMRRVRARSVA